MTNEDILGDYEDEVMRFETKSIVLEDQPRIMFETVLPDNMRVSYRGFLIANDATELEYGTIYRHMVFVPDVAKYTQARKHRMDFMCTPKFEMYLPYELHPDTGKYQPKEPTRGGMVILDD